jgi:hypothetical protein
MLDRVNIFSDMKLGERRDVYLTVSQAEIRLAEATEGELTREVYEAPARESEVVTRDIPAFLNEFACDLDGLRDALQAWFADNNQLADLMDCLDGSGISYEFLQRLGDGIVAYRACR